MLSNKENLLYVVQSHKSKWSVHKNASMQIKTSKLLSGMLDTQYNTGKSKIKCWKIMPKVWKE